MYRLPALLVTLAASLSFPAQAFPVQAETPADIIRKKLNDPAAGLFVVAHRGCHNATPSASLGEAPENSLLALEHCVKLGVDMVEIDIRRTKDGQLVILHDETLERTTNGTGRIAERTLAEIRDLRLRQNLGGDMSPTLTDERLPTLGEALAAAKGRIMLNLDVKEEIYAQAIAEVEAAGMLDYVLVKRLANDLRPALADEPLYQKTLFMPIVGHWRANPGRDPIGEIAKRQLSAQRKPVGIELVFTSPAEFVDIAREAKARNVRLWANTLTAGGVISVIGKGGDLEALRDGGQTWTAMIANGVDTIQTDEPGPLLDILNRR